MAIRKVLLTTDIFNAPVTGLYIWPFVYGENYAF